jgi:hypothetical protein
VDGTHGDARGLGVAPGVHVEIVEAGLLGRAGGEDLAGAAHEPLRPHELLEIAAQHVLLAEAERLEEGAVGREDVQVFREQEQAGGHARHDLVRVALETRHRAGLAHLLLEQPGALLLAVERDQEAGQGQEQEGGRRAGEPSRPLEVGERLVAVHLEHERPAGGRDTAHRGQHRHAAVVHRLADRLVALPARDQARARGRAASLRRRWKRRLKRPAARPRDDQNVSLAWSAPRRRRGAGRGRPPAWRPA